MINENDPCRQMITHNECWDISHNALNTVSFDGLRSIAASV